MLGLERAKSLPQPWRFCYFRLEKRGKRKEERGKRKEEKGKRKEERESRSYRKSRNPTSTIPKVYTLSIYSGHVAHGASVCPPRTKQ